jgi:uncharacterized membrane protein YeiH
VSKVLVSLSFVSLLVLIAGTALLPNNPVFWLATSGEIFQRMREALAAVLLLQLFTRPPRHMLFRITSGLLAISVAGWTLGATYSNHMLFLDSMSFLAAAFAIGLTALELQPTADSRRAHHGSL